MDLETYTLKTAGKKSRLNLDKDKYDTRERKDIVRKTFIFTGAFLLLYLIFYPFPLLTQTMASSNQIKFTILQEESKVELKLPFSMQVRESPFHERELLQYSAYLNDEVNSLRGYIQTWQIEDLNQFLRQSKDQSTFDFYSYSLSSISVGKFQGVLNIWGASFGDLSTISAKEYWLQLSEKDKFLRLVFLTNKSVFTEEQNKLIAMILSSINEKSL